VSEWSIPAVLDVVTDAVPDREMLIWESTRRTFGEVATRSRGLAAFLVGSGLGLRSERSDLAPWECGQSTVAILMGNRPEYAETMIAAYRARAVPVNVNHHYHPREIADLLRQVGAEAVVYQRKLAGLLAEWDTSGCLLIDVDDGSGVAPLSGSTTYESVLTGATSATLPAPSPDDLYLICTGGTTGAPKAVLWRQADIYVSGMSGFVDAEATAISGLARQPPSVWYAPSPLMHAAGQRTVLAAVTKGGTAVLHDDSARFSAAKVLEVAEREHVNMMSLVGDAYGRPIVDELRRRPYDLSALQRIGTGGSAMTERVKQELVALLPHVTILDSYSSSETGGMASAVTTKGAPTRAFMPSPTAAVLSDDRTRVLRSGDSEVGWTARRGRIPLGYLHDPVKTEQTFPVVDGVRYVVPGDRARLAEDGQVVLLGRDAMVINTGGEKVFVEEVEEAIRQHPDVLDALVVGRPSDRFGSEVVALVQLRPGREVSEKEIREFAATSIARFKAPRSVLFCDRIGRLASGKADYRWAKEVAEQAIPAV
jgi:fatty-acyl-CoA synthase